MRPANLAIGVLILRAAFGQATTERLTFDVASIKPFSPPQPGAGGGRGGGFFFGRGGGPGTPDPGRVNWTGASLRDLLTTAYDVKRYQVTGPAWLDSERYEIVAKVPAGATKEQVNVMWQNLLADRFGVVLHRESKEFQVEELTEAKGGSKLKETELDAAAQAAGPPTGPPSGPPKLDKNGFPELPGPGQIIMIGPGPTGQMVAHLVAKARTMADLTDLLGNQLNKPVVNKTGLTGKYDYAIEYTPDLNGLPLPPPPPGAGGPGAGPAAAPGGDAAEPGSNLVSAVQQQLGLKLTTAKAKLDVLVIDKAEKVPTEN